MHSEKAQPLPRSRTRFVETEGLSDRELIQTANHYSRGRISFVLDMPRRLEERGSLTVRQREALDRIIQENARPDGSREANMHVSRDRFSALLHFIARGAQNLQHPKIVFDIPGIRICIKYMKTGRNAGGLYLSNGTKYGEAGNVYYGKVTTEGVFEPSHHCTDAVVNILLEMQEDPARAALRYAKQSKKCCFCDQELTDERSVQAGYGPVCASRYALPWGN